MDISVIICTYNRCEALIQALQGAAASKMPPFVEWELLVIDNNSKDRTRSVVEEFCARHPRIRYIFEPKQGLSNARNAGIAAARGRVIAFTDDDVAIDPTWLVKLTQPLLNDECDGTAGRIFLGHFTAPPWLATTGPHNLGGSLVQFDLGDQQVPLDRAPFGASMAFQKKVFDRFGGFRTDLGRSGKNLIGNEDTEFGMRLIAGGVRLLYTPQAIVYHPVLQERLTKKYFRSYWFSLGRAQIRQKGEIHSFWRVLRSGAGQFRQRLHWMSFEDRHWYRKAQGRFYVEMHALQALGQIVEGWSQLMKGRQRETTPSKSDLKENAL